MHVTELKIQNFLGYRSAEVSLDDLGLVLVVGQMDGSLSCSSNGSGKSALFVDALPWALYGRLVRERVFGRATREFSADDVVNLAAGCDCRVMVKFTVGKAVYTVTRYRKHATEGNSVHLLQALSGSKVRVLTGESVAETNAKIEKLVGMSFETFISTVIFAQGSARRYTQCTDGERRKMLEEFFDFAVFDRALELAKGERAKARIRVVDVEGEMYRSEGALEAVSQHLVGVREDLRRATKPGSQRQVGVLTEKLNNLLDAALKLGKKSVERYEKLRVERARACTAEAGAQSDLESARRSLNDIKRRLKKYKTGEVCPECLREFRSTSETSRYRNKLGKSMSEAEAGIAQLEMHRNRCVEESLRTEKELNGEMADNELRAVYKSQIAVLQSEIREATTVEDTRKDLLKKEETFEGERTKLTLQLKEKKRTIAELSRQVDAFDFWVEGFGVRGIKDFCFRNLISYVNRYLVEATAVLTQGEMEIVLDDEARPRINVRGGAGSYILASGGQARRADLCIALALQAAAETKSPIKLLVIDEFDAGLDAVGIDCFAEYLRSIALEKGTVIVISHNPRMTDLFEQTLVVRREGDESKLEGGKS